MRGNPICIDRLASLAKGTAPGKHLPAKTAKSGWGVQVKVEALSSLPGVVVEGVGQVCGEEREP